MKQLFGTLTIAALIAALVVGITYSRNKQLKEQERADYLDHVSPRL